MSMSIEWDGGNPTMHSGGLVDIPGIKGGIASQMSGEEAQSQDGVFIKGAEIGDIGLIERLGILSQHDIPIVWGSGSRDAGAIAPNVFLFFFGGAVRLLLIGGAFDPKPALGITRQAFGFVVAFGERDARVVLFDPGINMFHIEGDGLAQTGNFGLQSGHRTGEQVVQEVWIQGMQFLAEPEPTRQTVLRVKAIVQSGIKHQMEAEVDDEQGMVEQKASQLTRVDEAFANADEERFEVGGLGMSRSATRGALLLPALDDGPIHERKESALLLHDGISIEQVEHGGLVKAVRSRYHSRGLLLYVMMWLTILCNRSSVFVKGQGLFA